MLIVANEFTSLSRDAKCPCNSGKLYKFCCLKKTGVKSKDYKFKIFK
ncbi:SEC-C domain-containing protein [Candidatus Dependentiae bacterium]|nr:SEC-C domain-containing protein [Candidatus Dependentiae bacterium]